MRRTLRTNSSAAGRVPMATTETSAGSRAGGIGPAPRAYPAPAVREDRLEPGYAQTPREEE